MKKIFFTIFKSLIAGVVIIVLGTAGINAVDNRGNLSESIVGKLLFGGSKKPCPADMIFIESEEGNYCIDEYEVSSGDECDFQNPADIKQSQKNVNQVGCFPVSEAGKNPWVNVSQNQAVRACIKAGKRLPSNKEWSRAAIGTPDKDAGWLGDDCQVDNNWASQPGPTGSGEQCVAYSGAFDMIGNVWEWVDGAVTNGKYNDRDLPKSGNVSAINESDAFPSETKKIKQELYYDDYFWVKDTQTRAIARGGFWNNKQKAGQYSHYIVVLPNFSEGGIGFRCVKSAFEN